MEANIFMKHADDGRKLTLHFCRNSEEIQCIMPLNNNRPKEERLVIISVCVIY
jgi:hypothetical protein